MGKLSVPAGARIYLDANILIHLVEGYPAKHRELDLLLQRIEKADVRAVTSELSLAEVLVKPHMENNARLIDLYEGLLVSSPQLEVVPVTRQVLRQSAMLRADQAARRHPRRDCIGCWLRPLLIGGRSRSSAADDDTQYAC